MEVDSLLSWGNTQQQMAGRGYYTIFTSWFETRSFVSALSLFILATYLYTGLVFEEEEEKIHYYVLYFKHIKG